jgi:CheY-like chemotaxis protein
MTVLIVEDDEDIRSMVAVILDSEGYQVAVANDGHEALRFLRTARNVGLVLTDIMMPILDGWMLLHAMRSDAALAGIPVVVMTGSLTPSPIPTAVQILKKPFRMDALLETVRSQYQGTRPGRPQTAPLAAATPRPPLPSRPQFG